MLEATLNAPGWPPVEAIVAALDTRDHWVGMCYRLAHNIPAPDIPDQDIPAPDIPTPDGAEDTSASLIILSSNFLEQEVVDLLAPNKNEVPLTPSPRRGEKDKGSVPRNNTVEETDS